MCVFVFVCVWGWGRLESISSEIDADIVIFYIDLH